MQAPVESLQVQDEYYLHTLLLTRFGDTPEVGTIIYKDWIWTSHTYEHVPMAYRNTFLKFKITPAHPPLKIFEFPLNLKKIGFQSNFYFLEAEPL